MGRHCAPRRPQPVVPAIGASAGVIGLAALVAALDTVVVPATVGTPTSARGDVAPASSEAPWTAGPLELPGIGVVAPDFEAAYAALHAPAPTPATSTTWPAPTSASASAAAPSAPGALAPSPTPQRTEEPEVPAVLDATPTPEAPARTPSPEPPLSVGAEPDDTATPPTTAKPPTEEPAEQPPTDEPPTDEAPVEQPPTDEAPVEEPPTDEPPVEEPPVEEPMPADVDLALGEELQVTDPATGTLIATVVVEEFVVDVACTAEGATAAENGHLVGLRVRMTTGAAMPEDRTFDAASFTVADGTGTPAGPAATAAAAACLPDRKAFPTGPLAPGTEHAGVVVLDVPVTTGTVTYRPDPAVAGGRWTF